MMIEVEQDRQFVLSVELIAPTLQVPHQGPIQSTTKCPPIYPKHNVTFLSPKLVQVKQQHFFFRVPLLLLKIFLRFQGEGDGWGL